MKAIIIVAFLTLTTLSAHAAEVDKYRWTTLDTGLQIAATALTIADWSQTLYGARHPGEFEEKNALLGGSPGHHPSEGRVNSYFASMIVLNGVVSYLLPAPYRNIWQSIWIGVEFRTVEQNINAGIKIGF